jgi:trans-aconitate 2-methyltransferase
MWDAGQYLRFGGERSRPFFDLVGQVRAAAPRYVADLGCGPGNLTAALAERWPEATVVGVDNSAEMIAAARATTENGARGPAAGFATGSPGGNGGRESPTRGIRGAEPPVPGGPGGSSPRTGSATGGSAPGGDTAPNLSFALGDVRNWAPERPVDVLVCNAVLQWVPGHDELLLRWADLLAPDGWLAFQLPGNFDQPSHVIVKEMAQSPRWRGLLGDVRLNRQAGDPADYVALLARRGFEVDAWETSYLHILAGDNPVLEWTKGTTLRPVLAALDAEQAASFVSEYGERLAAEYSPQSFGTLFPFRRVFTVVHRADVGHR